jgi:hypothetical protein
MTSSSTDFLRFQRKQLTQYKVQTERKVRNNIFVHLEEGIFHIRKEYKYLK